MDNELIELDTFTIHRPTLCIGPTEIEMYNTTIKDVLSGQYHVLKHIGRDDGDTRTGSLFLVHKDFAHSENLEKYNWQSGDNFYGSTSPLAIINYSSFPDKTDVEEKLCDNLVQVINNNVYFSIINNSTWKKYEVVRENNFIVAIKVDDIGAYVNTPNRQLINACQKGYLDQVKNLLKSNAADITYESYAPFDAAMEYAKISGDARIMKYLLMSQDLKVHTDITCAKYSDLFYIFDEHKNIINDLIYDLPMSIIHNIQNLYEDYLSDNLQNEELEQAFKVRIFAEQLNKDLPQHHNVIKRPKV